MEPEAPETGPWRKQRPIKIISAIDIVLATFSIFYNGKTLLVIFDRFGLHRHGETSNWPFVFLVLSITFGMQLLHIVLAMLLYRGSRPESASVPRSIAITKIWVISSTIFLILLIAEFCIGLVTFDYSEYIMLFVAFVSLKFIWRIYSIFYVNEFRKDLKLEMSGHSQNDLASTPVFKMVLTNPENCDVDVSISNESKSDLEDGQNLSTGCPDSNSQ